MMDEETRRMFMQMYARMLVNDGIIIKSLSHVVQTKDAADALYEYGDNEINSGLAISKSYGGVRSDSHPRSAETTHQGEVQS